MHFLERTYFGYAFWIYCWSIAIANKLVHTKMCLKLGKGGPKTCLKAIWPWQHIYVILKEASLGSPRKCRESTGNSAFPILVAQRIAIASRCLFRLQLKIATLTAGSAKNRRTIAQWDRKSLSSEIANFKSQCCLSPLNSKDRSKVPKLSVLKNRCDFLGALFRVATYCIFKIAMVSGAKFPKIIIWEVLKELV